MPLTATDRDHVRMTNTSSNNSRTYLVTITAWGGAPLFRDFHVARTASRILDAPKTWRHAECLAWVLMPDYWHGLIRLSDSDTDAYAALSKAVAQAKKKVSKALRDEGRTTPVWQRVFVNEIVEDAVDLRVAARELVMAPMRAKLVARMGDYPYWNAIWTKDQA